jgi:hypothetical protein
MRQATYPVTRFLGAETWPGEYFPQCAEPPDNTLDPLVGLQLETSLTDQGPLIVEW